MEGGTLSGSLVAPSLRWLREVLSGFLLPSAAGGVCSFEPSATEIGGVSRGWGLGWGLCCLLFSESLRVLGDWSLLGVAEVPAWLDVDGFSISEGVVSLGGPEAALRGDFGVRGGAEGRPGATLGLMEKRFLLWRAAEELEPSPFWSVVSLKHYIKQILFTFFLAKTFL